MRAPLEHTMSGAVRTILRHNATARRALMRGATARGRSLVLCYHRVAPVKSDDEVITPIPPERFAEQMRALRDMGEVVPLDRLLAFPRQWQRPVFAVTFDDDDSSHVRFALPILQEFTIPATFFLSGRALNGCGPYWWTLLEQSIAEVGLDATCDMLGRSRASSARSLVRACRAEGITREVAVRLSPPVMDAADIRILADAGMTIGFHTLRHAALPQLDDPALQSAMTEGRGALEVVACRPIDLLAYPYGRADHRVANAARNAGYRAAFTTEARAIAPASDPFFIGRWQPGPDAADAFAADAAIRLARP
jgi:peptidoglycan/xylan/chitin deacetylase (PgdA/CDA1 family)